MQQNRVENNAADGFILLPSYVPQGFQLLTGAVLPILQDRGLLQLTTPGRICGNPRPVSVGEKGVIAGEEAAVASLIPARRTGSWQAEESDGDHTPSDSLR